MRKALACSVALLALACAVALAAVPVTSEITVNTGLPGRQVQPSVAMDADGDFAVVWEDRAPANREIHLRRFTPTGGPSTGAIRMDTTNADDRDPAVAMSASGVGVAAWRNAEPGQILARRFDADSAEGVSEFPVDTSVAAGPPDVAVDADGDFVVVWEDSTASPTTIRGRRFDETGTPQGAGPFTVNEPNASASVDPAVAVDANGNFVVAWERGVAAGNDDVFARIFNANESPRTSDIPIATGTTDQDDSEVAMDADGDLAVAWESGDPEDLLAKRYSSAGAATTSAFPVHSASAAAENNVRIGLDAAGASLAVAWDSNASGSDEVRARRFNAGGTPLSGEVPVNTTVAGDQGDPGLGADASGRFVVAWESPGNPEDIIARRFDPGTAQPPPSDPPQQAPPLPPECQNPTTLLVTCAQLARPAVCGPTGTILPACYFPVRLPTVCGPSFGTILAPCQARGPNTVACGGTGTILPQCNLPAPNIPQVCGPSSGGPLPACTGANAPITVCGPSFGSIVPACNFATKIKAEVFNLNSGKGQLDITLNCPRKAGSSGALAAQKGKSCPSSGTITLADWRAVQKSTIVSAASTMANLTAPRIRSCIETNNYTCQGTLVPESQWQTTLALAGILAGQNARSFVTRTGKQIDGYLYEGGPPPNFVASDVLDNLTRITTFTAAEGPSYRRPELLILNAFFYRDVDVVYRQLESAVQEYQLLLKKSKPQGSSAASLGPAAGAALVRRSKTTVKRFKLRRGRKKRIRIKLTRKDVRKLARYAGRRRTLPVRVIVSFKAKPRPVARVFDIRLPIKPKKAKKKSKKR